jgi:hypothetical protein
MTSTKSTLKKQSNQSAFLEAFSLSGHVGNSALKAGIERTTVYLWRNDEEFEVKFEAARKQAISVLEDEAHRRAYTGVDEPVFFKGQQCGVVRKYSDTLLIVLLKANAPDKYRERMDLNPVGKLELVVKWDGNRNEAGSTSPAPTPATG